MPQDTVRTAVAAAQLVATSGGTTKDFFEAHAGLWAFGSALAALSSVAVAVIGLRFIWRQLKASRQELAASATSAQAAADAAKIAFSSTRPWIKFEIQDAILYFHPSQPEVVGCQIGYRIENAGKTPAIDVAMLYKPLPQSSAMPQGVRDELDGLPETGIDLSPIVLFPGDVIAASRSMTFPFPAQPQEDFLGFKIVAAVVYRASPEGEMYRTPVVLDLQHAVMPPDRKNRFYRGMGTIKCLVMRSGRETPSPT